MKTTLLLAAAGFGGLLCVQAARADWLSSTLGEPVAEVSHTVDVRVRDGVATFTVQRVFGNSGERPDEAVVGIDLPEGAAATGLRIRARSQWYRGELLEAETAARRYEELTGMGAFELKDPALLRWESAQSLTLQVFPVPAGGASTVEYTLSAPLRYAKGMYWLDYPTAIADGAVATPVVRVDPGFGDARTPVRVDGIPVTPGAAVVLGTGADQPEPADGDEGYPIAIAPGPIDVVAGRLGRVVASKRTELSRLDIDAAPTLAPLPAHPSVVFVVDASYSVDTDGLDAQLAVARAYLSHVPDARVEVVVYRRTATRLFGEFIEAARFESALERATGIGRLELGNGSHLDEGIALSARLLRGRKGATRVVAFTDDGLRTAFDVARTARALRRAPAGTVAHVVSATAGTVPAEWRDDDHRLAAIARATGGIYAEMHTGDDEPEALAAVTLGLVRPIRIDHFDIEGLPEDETGERPDSLPEGEGYRYAAVVPRAPTRVVVRGQLWSRPFSRTVRTTAAFDRATAALAFGTDMHESLDEAEIMRVARFGRAVSPVTSYLAIEPGVRPSREGIDRDGFGGIGSGAYGVGIGLAGSGRGGGGATIRPDLKAQLKPAVRRCLAEHPQPAGWSIALGIETTGTEIVDVAATGASAFGTCVHEGVWRTRLVGAFAAGHANHSLTIGAADFE